ncbi:CHY zinc finger protein [Alkalibacillus haloalkaliphilus]|uniref:CHY-type domain-containing protein n=1 Tax=Alkalibacillus haloalkaliphilus TaxID=94136 RepID=A0A511W4U6_9BACI|nr:CHY zinc finger protein [Alkalibacillus haloalkaliphilus]GEN45977.1 hypothetical protein AHA02nite_17530 [Alkalibacillus haloalkaliphilus]
MLVHGKNVFGSIDQETRCNHYNTEVDRIAIKFKCCKEYFPCYKCHEEHTSHAIEKWAKDERDTKAILCGSCGNELTIHEYTNHGTHCPKCNAQFNINCQMHYHLYFEL